MDFSEQTNLGLGGSRVGLSGGRAEDWCKEEIQKKKLETQEQPNKLPQPAQVLGDFVNCLMFCSVDLTYSPDDIC